VDLGVPCYGGSYETMLFACEGDGVNYTEKWKRYDFKPIHAVRSAFKKKVRRFPNGTPYTRQVNLRMCNRAFEELREISNKKGVSMNIYLNDIIETAIKKEVEQNVQKQI